MKALILGFDLGDDVTVLNITNFGSAMGKMRKDNGKKKRPEAESTWIDEALKFRTVSEVQWNEFLRVKNWSVFVKRKKRTRLAAQEAHHDGNS